MRGNEFWSMFFINLIATLMEEPGACDTLDPSCLFSFHRYLFERIKFFADQSRSVGACSRNQALAFRQVRCPHEDLWLRVLRKSVVAVPMEVAPRARSRRVGSQSTFNRIASLKSLYIRYTIARLSGSSDHGCFQLELSSCVKF